MIQESDRIAYLQRRGFTHIHSGKVREIYASADHLLMYTTDRVSAFDIILSPPIPTKGQILNELNAYFQHQAASILPTWMVAMPTPNTMLGWRCTPFPIEFVTRGYLSGHAARMYAQGARNLCGEPLPDGLRQNDPLPKPILTPTTKAETDTDITFEQIIEQQLMTFEQVRMARHYALKLFAQGTQLAAQRGLLLVDAKYELGLRNNIWYVLDELHTPDAARYFYKQGYQQRQNRGEPQPQLSKEALRQWLIEQGRQGQSIPLCTQEVQQLMALYQRMYERLLSRRFVAKKEPNTREWIQCMDRAFETLENNERGIMNC